MGTNSAWRGFPTMPQTQFTESSILMVFRLKISAAHRCLLNTQVLGYLVIRHYGPSGNPTRWGIFDIQNGTVGNSVLTGGGSTSVITHSISEDLGNGWYLCTFETDVPVQGGSNGCNPFPIHDKPNHTIATASATEIQYVVETVFRYKSLGE